MRKILLGLVAISAAAQPVTQATRHGLIVDDQGTYLFDQAEAAPPNVCINQRERTLLQRLVETAPNAGFQLPATTATPCVEFESWIEPLPEDFTQSVAGGFAGIERGADKTTLQRFVRDNKRRIYVSYSVTVERLLEDGAYRVMFGGSNSPAPADLRSNTLWKIASPVRAAVPQIVRDGDEIPVELYAAGADGFKLVDYLRVGRRDKMAQRKEAPRDSYAEDAEFSFSQPRLTVNGLAQEAANFPEAIRGGIVWIYVPGHGRYVLSFASHRELGFQPVGEAGGSLMTLAIDGNVFRIGGHDRIAAGGGIYNVYGLRDAEWQPADPADRSRFLIGTSPGIETASGSR